MRKIRNKRVRKALFYLSRYGTLAAFVVLMACVVRYISVGRDSKTVVCDKDVIKSAVEKNTHVSVKDKKDDKDDEGIVNLSSYPEKLVELYKNNKDAREYVLDYYEKKDTDYDVDLSDSSDCDDVPLFMQWDYRWGYKMYSGDLFGLTGCGPTCLSMAAVYLTHNTEYSPKWMLRFSVDNGYSVDGSGSAWTLVSAGAKKLGMNVSEIPLSKETMIDSISKDSLIIAVMGPGDFTTSGHFIVIKGYDNGFLINDPNSYVNSQKKWEYDTLKGQIKNMWKVSI